MDDYVTGTLIAVKALGIRGLAACYLTALRRQQENDYFTNNITPIQNNKLWFIPLYKNCDMLLF